MKSAASTLILHCCNCGSLQPFCFPYSDFQPSESCDESSAVSPVLRPVGQMLPWSLTVKSEERFRFYESQHVNYLYKFLEIFCYMSSSVYGTVVPTKSPENMRLGGSLTCMKALPEIWDTAAVGCR